MDDRFAYDELVFDGIIAKVHRVGLKMPDGEVIQRDLIHYSGAAVVLPLLDDGSVVLIQNYRFAVDERLWELPAGLLEEGEDPLACAARELTEETGYTAGKVEKLGSFFPAPGTNDEVMHAYLATELSEGEQDLERYEDISVEIFTQDDLRRMIADGTIHDGKTITVLALYWLKMGTWDQGPEI